MIGLWTHQWLSKNQFASHYFTNTTSTNLLAKEAAMGEESAASFYVAETQSAGRGQGQNKWFNSEVGTNLLMTCSLRSQTPPQPELCLTFGEHLHAACLKAWPSLNWRVKPPNDLYLSDRKVAGILLESVSQGSQFRLLFGLGFNVLNFPKDTQLAATCVQEHLSEPLTKEVWEAFLESLLAKVLNDPLFH